MARFLLQSSLVCIVFIAAWRAGGKPERYVATIYLTMLVAGSFHAFVGGPFSEQEYEEFYNFRSLLDIVALAAVVFVALRYDRWWTLWVGSAQFIAVTAHLLRALAMPIHPLAYDVMERWPVWIAVLLTGLGTFLHNKRSQVIATSI